MEVNKEWFADWFDSPYYHILYKERDMQEAEFFLKNLISEFKPDTHAHIIDLACGKGRHSIFLNSLGFQVTGVDLSEKSILAAKAFENDNLHFEIQDLRCLKLNQKFDIALNLFTSFGYFDDLETDEKVLNQIYEILNPDAFLLIDFFNAHKVISAIKPHEIKVVNDIEFNIRKSVKNNQIVKEISFSDQGQDFSFAEKVQSLNIDDFKILLARSGFDWIQAYGDYGLNPFEVETSDRLIILAKKKHA